MDNQEDWISMERELLEQNIAKGFIYGSKKTLALQQQHDNRVVCAIGGKYIILNIIVKPSFFFKRRYIYII